MSIINPLVINVFRLKLSFGASGTSFPGLGKQLIYICNMILKWYIFGNFQMYRIFNSIFVWLFNSILRWVADMRHSSAREWLKKLNYLWVNQIQVHCTQVRLRDHKMTDLTRHSGFLFQMDNGRVHRKYINRKMNR